jgi:hypothetical protein
MPTEVVRESLPYFASYFVMYSAADFFSGFESEQLLVDQHGPMGRNVPLPSLPTTRRKSGFATPWVW